ncbi:MAG: ATP-binding cassette domain-containing protein [Actinomycetes bacterium]
MRVEVNGLDKHFRKVHAVKDLSFAVEPGRVTGFLGPNGSGKSTSMRLMLGLDNGAGSTLFDGKSLTGHKSVTRVVGAHLDAKFFHPKRTAYAHLRMLGAESRVSKARVNEVLQLVGLESVAKKRPGGFSLGMGQRLGLAGAILADPQVLILDEPANGLDPQSIQWMRDFLRFYASQGRSVLVSSHLLSEMQLLADDVVVIARGSLIAAESMNTFLARSSGSAVKVRTNNVRKLAEALNAEGLALSVNAQEELRIPNVTTDQVGDIAFRSGVALLELTAETASLESVFLELTESGQEYRVGVPQSGIGGVQ